jgi:hypothetical protein
MEYPSESMDSDDVKRDIANAYYEETITYDEVKAILGPKEAENLRLLKDQLENHELTEEVAAL